MQTQPIDTDDATIPLERRIEHARAEQTELVAEADRREKAAEAALLDFQREPTRQSFTDAEVAKQLATNAREFQRSHEADVLAPLLEEQAQAGRAVRAAELRREFDPARLRSLQQLMTDAIENCIATIDTISAELAEELAKRQRLAPEAAAHGVEIGPVKFETMIGAVRDRLARHADPDGPAARRHLNLFYRGVPNSDTDITLHIVRPVHVDTRVG
jgi:hypothetical protein